MDLRTSSWTPLRACLFFVMHHFNCSYTCSLWRINPHVSGAPCIEILWLDSSCCQRRGCGFHQHNWLLAIKVHQATCSSSTHCFLRASSLKQRLSCPAAFFCSSFGIKLNSVSQWGSKLDQLPRPCQSLPENNVAELCWCWSEGQCCFCLKKSIGTRQIHKAS